MANRERSVQLHLYVSEAEYDFIQRKMARANVTNFSEYARRMLLNGYIIRQDFTVLRELAKELLEGKFEYVIATHVDQKHIHNHIIFNATSFYDYKKFRSQPGKTASKIRAISDRICAEADLSVIKQAQFDKTYRYRKQRGTSWRRLIRRRLLFVLEAAGSFDEFVEGAARLGVTVGISKDDLSYMLEGQGQKNLVYGKSMDKNGTFTREGIEAQIVANTDIREQLKQNIREAAATATDCKEFRAELQRRGIKATQTRKMGMRYAIGKEDVVWEWALGPAYSTEAIQAAFYSPQSAFEKHGSPLDGFIHPTTYGQFSDQGQFPGDSQPCAPPGAAAAIHKPAPEPFRCL